MNHAKILKHLAQADENVRKGKARVAEQEARIKQLSSEGHNTDLAEATLASFKQALRVLIQTRQVIVEELEKSNGSRSAELSQGLVNFKES